MKVCRTNRKEQLLFTPKARFRFYGTPHNYLGALNQGLATVVGLNKDYREPLERCIAEMANVDHAICVPQARFGLYLILTRLLSPSRPNVIMSPYTIHDVVNMVICAGGRPIFADVDQETCNIDSARLAELIDSQTGAVMVTHLHGLACDMEQVMAVCNAGGVPVIEDAAQAFGSKFAGRMLGSIGKAGVFSFGRAKNLNAFYGGMILTSDDSLASDIRAELASLPIEDTGKIVKRIIHCCVSDLMTLPPIYSLLTFKIFRYAAIKGIESVNKVVQTENNPTRKDTLPTSYRRRLTSVQARLVLDQLSATAKNTKARQDLARIYHEGLSGAVGILLPPWREDGSHVYLQYPVQVEDRWSYVRYMMSHGRDVAIQHMASASDLNIFKEFSRDCPNARKTAERLVLLPTYPNYGADEARANVKVTLDYLRGLENHR